MDGAEYAAMNMIQNAEVTATKLGSTACYLEPTYLRCHNFRGCLLILFLCSQDFRALFQLVSQTQVQSSACDSELIDLIYYTSIIHSSHLHIHHHRHQIGVEPASVVAHFLFALARNRPLRRIVTNLFGIVTSSALLGVASHFVSWVTSNESPIFEIYSPQFMLRYDHVSFIC